MANRKRAIKMEPETSDEEAGPSSRPPPLSFSRSRKNKNPEEGTERNWKHPDYYHKSHYRRNLVVVPDEPEGEEPPNSNRPKKERDEVVSVPGQDDGNYEEIKEKALAMSSLPSAATLQLLAHCQYDLSAFEARVKDLVVPELFPGYLEDYVGAEIYQEKRSQRRAPVNAKPFVFEKSFGNVVSRGTIVDFYYKEKNKVKSNWKLREEKDDDLGDEEEAELTELMEQANISVVKPNGTIADAPIGRRKRNLARRVIKAEPLGE